VVGRCQVTDDPYRVGLEDRLDVFVAGLPYIYKQSLVLGECLTLGCIDNNVFTIRQLKQSDRVTVVSWRTLDITVNHCYTCIHPHPLEQPGYQNRLEETLPLAARNHIRELKAAL